MQWIHSGTLLNSLRPEKPCPNPWCAKCHRRIVKKKNETGANLARPETLRPSCCNSQTEVSLNSGKLPCGGWQEQFHYLIVSQLLINFMSKGPLPLVQSWAQAARCWAARPCVHHKLGSWNWARVGRKASMFPNAGTNWKAPGIFGLLGKHLLGVVVKPSSNCFAFGHERHLFISIGKSIWEVRSKRNPWKSFCSQAQPPMLSLKHPVLTPPSLDWRCASKFCKLMHISFHHVKWSK